MNRRHLLLQAALFVFLASIYMLTYSGGIETGDSLRLFDGVSSFATYGDVLLDQSASQFMPTVFDESITLPLAPAAVEPGQLILSVPLFWLARLSAALGQVQVVWLFNIIISALTCCLFFHFAVTLGYSETASLLAAAALGMSTALWVYSQTFFREPITALLVLALTVSIDRWRATRYRSLRRAALMIGLLMVLLFTRASAVFALPALAIVAARSPQAGLRSREAVVIAITALVIGLVAMLFIVIGTTDLLPDIASRYDIFGRLRGVNLQNFAYAFGAYIISPGGSFWGTSPVLLLGIPGALLLIRARRRRYAIAALALIVSMATGYAIINGAYWFGGLSWPPRFLVPTIPFMMILTLPVFERAVRKPLSGWTAIVVTLVLYGIWIQYNGVVIPWGAYALALPPQSNGFLEWEGGLYDPAYFRWILGPSLWETTQSSLAWVRFDLPGALMTFATIASAACATAFIVRRVNRNRLAAAIGIGLIVTWVGATAIWLAQLTRTDDRYRAYDDTLFAMLRVIAQSTGLDDIVLLSGPSLQPFFLNFDDRSSGGRVITLPLQPGERSSPEQPAQVEGGSPPALLTRDTIQLIANLAFTRERLFLLVDGGPDLWWSTRPVENYMNATFFPVSIESTGPITRLIEYDTTHAPDGFFQDAPLVTGDLTFGDQIRLTGADFPDGLTVHPGSVLPISLVWTALDDISVNLTTALYLRDAGGAPVTQSDNQPGGGFAPTSGWQVGALQRDNRGLRIPSETPPGAYQLWVKVYRFDETGMPVDLTVSGTDALDGVIGLLPVTVTVAE